jgi:hypothetical protein
VAGTNNEEIERTFLAEAYRFHQAVRNFADVTIRIHDAYAAGQFIDWPTVLLGTLLLTTAVSLSKLLPREESKHSRIVIDRRSIATLTRNIVDTHDSLDLLCDPSQSPEQFTLHRDILGHYLANKYIAFRDKGHAPNYLDKSREWYWSRICEAIPDKAKRRRLRDGSTLFYTTRSERLLKSCGEDASFVGKVLADLSTYVHSVPPALWLKSLEEAFDDSPATRGVLLVWVQIANFHFARSIRIVLTSAQIADAGLQEYIDSRLTVFRREEHDDHGEAGTVLGQC